MKSNIFKCFRDTDHLAVLAAWLVLWMVPTAKAADILEGTPVTGSRGTVFKATVEPGQEYSSVFSIRGDSSDDKCYGEVTITEGTVMGTVYGCRATSGDELTRAPYTRSILQIPL